MKEIQKAVQKLSCGQGSAAGGGARGGVRTGTKKSPSVYRGDLTTCVMSMWENDIKCKHMPLIPLRKFACKELKDQVNKELKDQVNDVLGME